jgi:2-polyprenyl-6-methoxyphenol hydroxylase-like FAD-dependent oxidoreductase
METTEVLIVGAGPVGLSLALECARHKLTFRIVDMAPLPSDKSKALAIWSAAQEVFSAMGVLDAMREQAFFPEGIRVCSKTRTLLRVPNGQFVDSPYPDVILLPQSSTEKILLERLEELGHRVSRPVELVSFEQDDDGVKSVLRHPDGREEIFHSLFLAGCDGAHSAVRRCTGANFSGRARPECYVLCDAEVTGPISPDVHIFVSGHGVLPMFPIHDRVWRIISTREGAAGTAPPTLEEMQEHLADRGPGGLTLSNAEWLSSFRISERKVERFRTGRVLLAGDAAHIHSPAGGQGMNTGIQDAFNLGWKLAFILRQSCSAEVLLESYQAERSPVAVKVIADAALRTRLVMVARGPLAMLRNAGAALIGRSHRAIEKLAVSFSGTKISYGASPALGQDKAWDEDWRNHGFAPGNRVRDVAVYDDETRISILQDVLSSENFSLLLFSGNRPNYRDADFLEGVRQEAAGFSSLLVTAAVWRGEHAPDESWLLDPDGSAHRRFGVDNTAAYLVRPDGYVAIRCQPGNFLPIAGYLSSLRQPKGQPTV